MNLKQLFDDDSAVSPVIGVILMVAITVILAAVIATFVLGLGEQISDTGPTASFDFEYNADGSASGDGFLTITHTGGSTIDADNLYVRGSSSGGDGVWGSSGSKVNAGSSYEADVEEDNTIRVVWESDEGGQSSTLEVWEGPNA